MGIVVCVSMLIGLLGFMPMPWRENQGNSVPAQSILGRIQSVAPLLLAIMGAWNALWYGLRNLGSFWGNAGLLTGLIMMMAAVLLNKANTGSLLALIYRVLNPLRVLVFVALLASFLLYLVTLIQLNLGYPIIR
ncbi:MAG: hypothetical protein AAF431_13850 [Pseudomonadota bacterium]